MRSKERQYFAKGCSFGGAFAMSGIAVVTGHASRYGGPFRNPVFLGQENTLERTAIQVWIDTAANKIRPARDGNARGPKRVQETADVSDTGRSVPDCV